MGTDGVQHAAVSEGSQTGVTYQKKKKFIITRDKNHTRNLKNSWKLIKAYNNCSFSPDNSKNDIKSILS